MAFLADYMSKGFTIVGYARETEHGKCVIDSMKRSKGVYLERPGNQNLEQSRLVPFENNVITHNLALMIEKADVIILPIPSHYHLDAVSQMVITGLIKKRSPIVLAPSRTFSSPYLWKILGDQYPLLCFSTSPYSCKTLAPNKVLIKRRKRTWLASLEGGFSGEMIHYLETLFPQAAMCNVPALTSLNNIGAVFHPATYLLNIDVITRRHKQNKPFSFYMEGIAARPDVAQAIETIDQIRLKIADTLGIDTFGLLSNPREDIWRKLIKGLRALEEEHENEIDVLRRIRKQFLEYINNCVISAQHWLDITYGVERIDGESLGSAIERTPTYQKNSLPQTRYVHEDIPTGLVPLESLAKIFGIDSNAISNIIDMYDDIYNCNIRQLGRNLVEFSPEYIKTYLAP